MLVGSMDAVSWRQIARAIDCGHLQRIGACNLVDVKAVEDHNAEGDMIDEGGLSMTIRHLLA